MFSTVAVVGSGAIGCYYGARLALVGTEVRFLMRSDLAHVRKHGLILREKDAIRHLATFAGFANAEDIGPVDVVLVTLKTTANTALAEILPPLVGPETIVVTLQNGLGNEATLATLVGAERVLGGLCFIAVVREKPGELRGFHTPGAMTLGEFNRPLSSRAQNLAALFRSAGVKCTAVDNLAEARWRKLIWNIPFNGLAITAGNITTDLILADPALAKDVRVLMEEVALAARTLGYEIPESFLQSQIDVTGPMGAYQPSSLIDFRAGREVEVEAIWGEPLRQAQAAGLAMPRLAQIYSELKRRTIR